MAGYGLTGKRLQPARLRNLYGGLQLRETTAAYGGLRRRLQGLHVLTPSLPGLKNDLDDEGVPFGRLMYVNNHFC